MQLRDYLSPGQVAGYLKDPLRRNALFLVSANALAALFGFVFWIIAARYYSSEDVGLATALISSMMLLTVIARFGFDISIVRFLPQSRSKNDIINTYLTVIAIVSGLLGIIFILGLSAWSPELMFIRENFLYALVFIIVTTASSVIYLQEHVFIACKKTHYLLVETALTGSRLGFLMLLMSLGVMGIYISWGISVGIAIIATFWFLFRASPGYKPLPVIKTAILKETIGFSTWNYVAEGFKELPKWIMPLIIIRLLSPEMSAYFYMAWTVASILYLISYATSFSLLAHGSHDPKTLRAETFKAAKFILLLLIPATVIIFLFGDVILTLFGKEYTRNAFDLLKLLSISSIPLAVNTLYITIKRVQLRMKPLLLIHGFIAVATIGISAGLMDSRGIIGIGIAWLASNTVVALFLIPVLWRMVRTGEDLAQ